MLGVEQLCRRLVELYELFRVGIGQAMKAIRVSRRTSGHIMIRETAYNLRYFRELALGIG